MPPGKEHCSTGQDSLKFAKCCDRTGEGYRPDQDANKDLDIMNGLFDSNEVASRVKIGGKTDQYSSQADEAMQHCDQLGHGCHFYPSRNEPSGCATNSHQRYH
jgi:hypothetical protein